MVICLNGPSSCGKHTVITALRNRVGSDGLVVAGELDVDLTVALDALQDKGLERILCEVA